VLRGSRFLPGPCRPKSRRPVRSVTMPLASRSSTSRTATGRKSWRKWKAWEPAFPKRIAAQFLPISPRTSAPKKAPPKPQRRELAKPRTSRVCFAAFGWRSALALRLGLAIDTGFSRCGRLLPPREALPWILPRHLQHSFVPGNELDLLSTQFTNYPCRRPAIV